MKDRFSPDADETENQLVETDVREGILKALKRTDLSPEDRKAYENALARLDAGGSTGI
jgi:hypothetical protein